MFMLAADLPAIVVTQERRTIDEQAYLQRGRTLIVGVRTRVSRAARSNGND